MRNAIGIAALALMTACGGGGSEGQDVPFTTVFKTWGAAATTSEGVMVRDQLAFNAVWANLTANFVVPPDQPAIDFSTHQLIGYFLGSRPNGCYDVSITRVTRYDTRLVVTYKERTRPDDPEAGCTASLVSPAHLVSVPQSAPGPVEFKPE